MTYRITMFATQNVTNPTQCAHVRPLHPPLPPLRDQNLQHPHALLPPPNADHSDHVKALFRPQPGIQQNGLTVSSTANGFTT